MKFQDHTFHYNCPWDKCWIEYEVSVKGRPQLFYTTYDDSGDVVDDSVLLGCKEDPDNAERTACKFYLGYLPNPEEEGVQNNWQRRAGIRTAPGTKAWYKSHEFKCRRERR